MKFSQIIKERRTIRFFSQEKLSNEDLTTILEAARCSSSASNRQILRYIVITSSKLTEDIFKQTHYAAKVTPHRSPKWQINSPTAFIAVTSSDNNPTSYAETGAAIQSMSYAAWERNIGLCWIGAFNAKECESILNIDTSKVKLLYLVALGFKDELPILKDISQNEDTSYYLDNNDVLNVPKIKINEITQWL